MSEYPKIQGRRNLIREVTFERAIIVEQDWPEYEKVWEMIETRVKNDAKISTCTDPANMI